jgi:hypothetical protein
VPGDRDALVSEIERYLAAVEVFRDQGYEPRWSCGVPKLGCAPEKSLICR